jgi:hypothetical protein
MKAATIAPIRFETTPRKVVLLKRGGATASTAEEAFKRRTGSGAAENADFPSPRERSITAGA